MRATIDKAGRLVIPKALRDSLGLVPGEVEVTPDGAGLHVEPLANDYLADEDGFLVIPADVPISDESYGRSAMPTSGDRPQLLIDTSVAVALVAAGHEHHQATRKAVGSRSCGLSGHAAFETFSVLTRMPPPNRRTPHAVARLLAHNFPGSRFLSAEGTERLHARLAELGIAGVAVYDALVAAAAAEHGIVLATRDRRAADTYRALEVDFELIN